MKNANVIISTLQKLRNEESPFQKQLDLLCDQIKNHIYCDRVKIPEKVLIDINESHPELKFDEYIPYFLLYETSTQMHNLTLEKIYGIKNESQKKEKELERQIRLKTAEVKKLEEQIECLGLEKSPLYEKFL